MMWERGRLEEVLALNDLIIDRVNFWRILRFLDIFIHCRQLKGGRTF